MVDIDFIGPDAVGVTPKTLLLNLGGLVLITNSIDEVGQNHRQHVSEHKG